MYYQDISTSLVKKSLNNKGGIIQPHRLSPLGSQHYHNYFAASGQGAFERQGQIPIPVLRKVAEKAFLINICINHACRLASPFSRPITNKATKGFSISLKNTNSTITPQQQKKITMLENFFLNCGFNTDNERGSLLRFMKKGIRDLLTVDQITTEIQYRTDGTPFAFWTVDPATIYRHPQDTEDDDIDFIQLIDCVPVAEFTSKQLIFDTMNPRSDIEHSLYGYSYVEQAIELITGMINSFTYNQGNFINDNLPRGAILINGDPDQSSVDLISDYIINMMSDPSQKWRIPVFPSGDENGTIQWVSFQKGNRDMEFTEWTNRLWTSVAALFGTDLEELGIRVNTGTSVIPENPEARIKASKSRVLDDVLRFFQDHFQHILDLIDDNYCFEFIGAEQNDLKLQNECRTNKLSTCYTINEVRQEEGLEPINEEWANIPLNPQLIILHGQMQGEQQPKAESGLNDDDPDDDNPPPNRDDENNEEYKSKHEDTDINAEDVEKSIDTSKCHKEEITDKNGVRRNVWKKNAETESNSKKLLKENAKKDFNNIEQSLSNGIDFTVNNLKIGEILIEQGSTGKHGYGLKHIIEQRYKKDGKSEDEITALLSLIVEAARNGEIVRNNEIIQNGKDIGTYYLEKNGIIAFVSKNKNGTNTQFVITGFDDNEKKEEAADAIKTVIADNSYTQEFIIVKQQVGAVIASLNGTTDKTSVVGGEILNNTSTSDSSISKSIDKSIDTSKCHKEEITDKNGVRRNVWKKNAEIEDNTKNEKRFVSKVQDWIVNLAKDVGIDIKGFKHKITGDFKRHVINHHGNTKIESNRHQIAVTDKDLENIDDVINNPTFAVAGVYCNNKPRIILVKNSGTGSILVEEVLSGKKNKALNAKTFWIADHEIAENDIVKMLKNEKIYDISNIKIATSMVTKSTVYSQYQSIGGGGKLSVRSSNHVSSISKSIDKSTFTKLDYFKKQLIDILVSQEKEENQNIEKAVKANIGEIRTRKDGFKYKKINNGEWKRIYESESKGAKLSIAAIKRKIDNAKDEEELMNIIMTNKQRFVDKMGFMLPIVQELNKYIDEKEASQRWQIDNKTNTTKGSLSDATDNTANRATKTPHIEKERADATMSKDPEQTSKTLHTSTPTLPQDTEKSSLADIKTKYESSKFVTGDNDEIILPDGTTVSGKWKIVEATAPSASHDEQTFHKTSGFPMNADGSTINDRDYEHDIQAQEMVHKIASDYDGRALSMDNPIVVTQDGVVISGNNRTMSSKIAARKGTDAKYIETLAKRCKKYGFSQSDLKNFKNPRVVFETQQNNYSTKEFARFNQSDKKTISPLEQAVKIAKTIDFNTVENIAENINEYETLGEMYQNKDVCSDIFNSLKESGIISDFDLPQYINNGVLTVAGKDFLETVLIGSVINENNLRSLNQDGCKNIRAKLVRAILPLTKNKGLKNGYSVNKELNEAIEIYAEIANEKNIKNVKEYRQQGNFFKAPDPLALAFAEKLEGTQKEFAELMNEMNGSLREAADGQFDMFFGGIESRDDILQRFLNVKKSLRQLKRTARIIIEV